jgi:CBS domain-containing protein
MTADPFVLRADDELDLAGDVMKLNRIRHMPVLSESDSLVGILSQRDLFRAALDRALEDTTSPPRPLRVKDAMAQDPVQVGPETPITEAANLMTERKIGCLPVVERGELIGILTEGDFVALMGSEERRSKLRREG